MPVALLPPDDEAPFPSVESAARSPNGLLAVGGSLRPARMLKAYRNGIFPWFGEGEPILWWSPDPRCVIFPDNFHVSRSFRRTLNKGGFRVSRDTAFDDVIHACAEPRTDSPGTWIVPAMIEAFRELNAMGYVTSFECWYDDRLVGGVYGLQLGRVLFGESMFSRVSDASKVALHAAATSGAFDLIDCQLPNPHLTRLGAETISRTRFLSLLERYGAHG